MNTIIPATEVEFSPLAIDENGSVFTWKNKVFRAIKKEAVGHIKELMSCGLIDELIQKNLFPKTWITEYDLEGYALIIQHEKIEVVSYPYEWAFSMLKDAALAILKVNQIALKYGYQTKDGHGWNIIFDSMTPKFIDLGSFKKITAEEKGWIAYEEFLRAYYYPLKLWSQGCSYFAKVSFLSHQPPRVSDFLFFNPFLRLIGINFFKKIVDNFFIYKRISNVTDQRIIERFPRASSGKLIVWLKNKRALPFLSIDYGRLIKKIEKINDKSSETVWGQYQGEYLCENSEICLSERFNKIIEIIKTINIKSVIELGGNQGVFSEALIKNTKVKQIICTDYDEKAIDILYNRLKNSNLKITPAILDIVFTNNVIFDLKPEKRFVSDVAVMLAVTHHLVLTQHIPLEFIMKVFSRYTKRYAIIEFMPLGLYGGDDKKFPSIPAWYNEEWFKNNFKKYFRLITREQVEKNRVVFVGELY